jgi:glycosyltransferase involved in cell wall biosynthesis
MIVRDEEDTLVRILAEAGEFCDELVVVDTGSTDRSREIAQEAGARVLDFTWIYDFAAARQYAFDACTGDWIIWLDADDSVPPEVRARMVAAKEELLTDELDSVWTPYRYAFSPDTGECTFSFNRERIVRRVPGLEWVGAVHEVLTIPGSRSVQRDDLYIEHRPAPTKDTRRAGRNLAILERAVRAGDRSPRSLFYFANELRDNDRHAEAFEIYQEYLEDPGATWEEYAAWLSLAECARKLEREGDAVVALMSAIRLDPSRATAFVALGETYYAREQWAAAVPLFAAATAARRPNDGFIVDADYTWRPWDYLGVCLANSGRHPEAIEATTRALVLGHPDKDRLRANLKWSVDQL